MSFFSWIFKDSRPQAQTFNSKETKVQGYPEKTDNLDSRLKSRPLSTISAPEGERSQRHVRREQVYVAIREAMTRASVLSSSYKFKVLSLDQSGYEFLVVVDLERVIGDSLPDLNAIEVLIAKNAELLFHIQVSAVYWRIKEVAPVAKPMPPQLFTEEVWPKVHSKAEQHHAPVQSDAFQQSLVAASSSRPAADARTKIRDMLRLSSISERDFEETEMTQYRPSTILSDTQFGDSI